MLLVQDYVLCDTDTDSPWLLTYNNDLVDSRIEEREGFTRMSVKMQGFVGVSISSAEEKRTRLTWLVNTDFRGIVSRAMQDSKAHLQRNQNSQRDSVSFTRTPRV